MKSHTFSAKPRIILIQYVWSVCSKCGGTQMAKIQYTELSNHTYLECSHNGHFSTTTILQVHISQTALITVFTSDLRQKKFERLEQMYEFCLHGLHITELLFLENSNSGESHRQAFVLILISCLSCTYFSALAVSISHCAQLQFFQIFRMILCNILAIIASE